MKTRIYTAALLMAVSSACFATDGTNGTASDSTKVKKLELRKVSGENIIKADIPEKPLQPKEKKVIAKPVQSINNVATFPGGDVGIKRYIKGKQRYPEACAKENAEGRTVVTVTVKPDGTVCNAKVTHSSGNEHMDAEALRVARSMPKWTPAQDIEKGKEITYPIQFNFRPKKQ
jgi:TonB family protein